MRYVILSAARTGSTLLCDVLNSSPDVHCRWEMLKPGVTNYGHVDNGAWAARRAADPAAFVEMAAAHFAERPVFGFKVFEDHAPDWTEAALRDSGWAKVVHYRKNVLAVYSSYKIAMAHNLWGAGDAPVTERADSQARPEAEQTVRHRTKFDADEFEAFRESYNTPFRTWLRTLHETGQDFFFSEYTELRNLRLSARLFHFLGASVPAEIRMIGQKVSTSAMLDRFANPDAVVAHLARIGRADWAAESFTDL